MVAYTADVTSSICSFIYPKANTVSPLSLLWLHRTLLVTEECLLDPSRNPHLGKEGIEQLLKEYLGIDKVIWLWKGMAGE
jgi:hypothetical protein